MRCTERGVRPCVQGRLPGGEGSLALGQLRVAAGFQPHCAVLLFEGTWPAVSGNWR